jgi:hypothetical protein
LPHLRHLTDEHPDLELMLSIGNGLADRELQRLRDDVVAAYGLAFPPTTANQRSS